MTRLVRYTGNVVYFFFFQAEDGIRDLTVTGVQTCALPSRSRRARGGSAARAAGARATRPRAAGARGARAGGARQAGPVAQGIPRSASFQALDAPKPSQSRSHKPNSRPGNGRKGSRPSQLSA